MSPQDEFGGLEERLRQSQPEAAQAPSGFRNQLRAQLLEKHDMHAESAKPLNYRWAWAAALLVALPLLYLLWSRGGAGLPPPEPEFTAGGPGPAEAAAERPLAPALEPPSAGSEGGIPVWIEAIGSPVPLNDTESELPFTIGYDLGDYDGGYITLSYEINRSSEGSGGGINSYVAAGESPLLLPVALNNGWLDDGGRPSRDLIFTLKLDGIGGDGVNLPIYPPADAPDLSIPMSLSVATVSYGQSAADGPALLVSLIYGRQVATAAALRLAVEGPDGLIAAQTITVTSRSEMLDLALPLSLDQLPADTPLRVTASLEAEPEPMVGQMEIRAGSLSAAEAQDKALWLEGWSIQEGDSPEQPPMLLLRLGYRVDQRYDHGTLAFDFQQDAAAGIGGGGGGGGGGEQMIPAGQGVYQIPVGLARSMDLSGEASWPAGLSVNLALRGVLNDMSQEPLGALSLPCPALAEGLGICAP